MGILLAGCVVTPEPIPLFDGFPVGIRDLAPQSRADGGTMDALTALDTGVVPVPIDGWAMDAPAAVDGPHLVEDGQPDLVDDGAPSPDGSPGEGGPGEGGPGEGGPTYDAISPTQDGLTNDVVARE